MSTYLDLLRIGAALIVPLGHADIREFGGGGVLPEHLAHEAVVVFFALSGYVIAYVAAEREPSGGQYLIARAARIYSVAVPALAITLAVDLALNQSAYQVEQPWKYLPVFLTFTTHVRFLNVDAFSDAPYWSLCYEVWFYLIFAAALFLRGRTRIACVGIALAIVGPRIWLLFPIWLAGAAAFGGRHPIGPKPARLLLAVSIIAIGAIWWSGLDCRLDAWVASISGGWSWSHLRYSRYFLGDWLTGGLIALSLLAARHADLRAPTPLRAVAAAAARFSFTLYLVHYPMLELLARTRIPHALMVPLVIAACWLISIPTERQKTLLRRALTRLAGRFPTERVGAIPL